MENKHEKQQLRTHQIEDIYREESAPDLFAKGKRLHFLLYALSVCVLLFSISGFLVRIPFYNHIPVTIKDAVAQSGGALLVAVELPPGKDIGSAMGAQKVRLILSDGRQAKGTITLFQANTASIVLRDFPQDALPLSASPGAVLVVPAGTKRFSEFLF